MDLLLSPETQDRIAAIEAVHRERLAGLAAMPNLEHPRLTGTIAAIDAKAADSGYTASVGPKLKAFFLEQGLLIRPLGNVIYVLPPYCIRDDELHRAYDAIETAAKEIL